MLYISARKVVQFPRSFSTQTVSAAAARDGVGTTNQKIQARWRVNQIKLKVNQQEKSYDGDPQMPLMWYLRDELALTGTKFGCGAGLCGACTVIIDGVATRSCQMAVGDVASDVRTIDGLARDGALHPAQQAWLEEQVAQCGYCQAGQIMNAVALLEQNPAPSDAEIDEAMAGNLCRCGTYPKIRAAIHKAAAMKAGA